MIQQKKNNFTLLFFLIIMTKIENKISCHHILPQSMNGSWEDINKEFIRNTTHRSIHTLFQNQMIARQLLTTVDLSSKALREDVRRWLVDMLNSKDIDDPYERYNPKAIK